jgi:hypothetical protein
MLHYEIVSNNWIFSGSEESGKASTARILRLLKIC